MNDQFKIADLKEHIRKLKEDIETLKNRHIEKINTQIDIKNFHLKIANSHHSDLQKMGECIAMNTDCRNAMADYIEYKKKKNEETDTT